MALSCFIVGFGGIGVSALLWTAHGNVPFMIFGAFVLLGARLLLRSWKHDGQRDSD
jgi:hypothetical protein